MGGELGGRRLEVARGTRPSSAQLRAALASIWAERIPGARVLDLFAGSGAVGLELLSRGAERAVFVESARAAAAALAGNLRLVSAERARRLAVEALRATRILADEKERFDLLFVDPPYEDELGSELLGGLGRIAAPGARLAIERRARDAPPEVAGWRAHELRRYGDAALHLFELEEPLQEAFASR